MSHVEVADIGYVLLDFIRTHRIEIVRYLVEYTAEDCRDGILAKSAVAEDELVAGRCVKLDDAHAGGFLAAVVLLLHHQIELVESVAVCAVFPAVVFKWFAQPDHGYAAFVFKWFH